ncbi:MAG: hypothetical protein IRY99_03475, partial [Isosphaeraceae bacterium]|nr:hypothetical protein [Isosphaeraceae bacterium]
MAKEVGLARRVLRVLSGVPHGIATFTELVQRLDCPRDRLGETIANLVERHKVYAWSAPEGLVVTLPLAEERPAHRDADSIVVLEADLAPQGTPRADLDRGRPYRTTGQARRLAARAWNQIARTAIVPPGCPYPTVLLGSGRPWESNAWTQQRPCPVCGSTLE